MVHGGTKGDEADVIIRNIMSGRVIKLVEFQDLIIVRYHVKLEIRLFVMNFNSGGFSFRVLYCVVDTGYGLGRSLGNCRPAKVKSTKWLKHKLRATLEGQ